MARVVAGRLHHRGIVTVMQSRPDGTVRRGDRPLALTVLMVVLFLTFLDNTVVSALISFGLLTVALKKLEVGPAYAMWTGLGAAGTAVVGMRALGESVSLVKLISIGLILAGVIGLNLSGVTPPGAGAVCYWPMSCSAMRYAALIGMANPTPMLPDCWPI
jgi:multidrug transporter EmrE-like cation transporter